MMSRGESEISIQSRIREALAYERDLVLFRNNSGRLGRVRFGLAVGAPDLVGFLSPSGRGVCLEVKTPKGKASEEQLEFMARVRRFGVFCAIVRSVEEARAAIERARRGELE